MSKVFLRFFIVGTFVYAISCLFVPQFLVLFFQASINEWNSYNVSSTSSLIKEVLGGAGRSKQGEIVEHLNLVVSPVKLQVVPMQALQVGESQKNDVSNGLNLVKSGIYGDLLQLTSKLDADTAVVITYPEPSAATYIFYAIINSVIGAILLIGLYAWMRPRWLDVEALRRTAIRMGAGDSSARVGRSRTRDLEELSKVFDQMAEGIENSLARHRELLGAVSHELRTPLSRLAFGLELITERCNETRELERLAQMKAQIRMLESLVGELLNFNRMDVPKKNDEKVEVDLAEFLDSVVGQFEESAELAGIVMVVSRHSAPTKFSLDPGLTARALSNLVSNALRYATSRVEIHARSDSRESLCLYVEDDGEGIPDSEKNKIFEPFYRMDRSRDRATGGFGLGLAICKKAISSQGGNIVARNSKLGGALVRISLPK